MLLYKIIVPYKSLFLCPALDYMITIPHEPCFMYPDNIQESRISILRTPGLTEPLVFLGSDTEIQEKCDVTAL